MVVLMYHAIGRPGEPPSRFVVPLWRFRQQMRLIRLLRYRVLSLERYLSDRRDGRSSPAHSLVITFDDGYADNRSVAPLLRRLRYPATIFLVTDRVGAANDWTDDRTLAGRALLTWNDVRQMRSEGIEFGAHTRTHPHLSALPEEAARREIIGSQMEVAQATGAPVRAFAYPYGDSSAITRAIAADAGYWGSCGTQTGKNTPDTPLHNLRRTEIRGTDSLVAFAVKLWTGKRAWRG